MKSISHRASGTVARFTLLGLAVSGFLAVSIPALAEEMGWSNDPWGEDSATSSTGVGQNWNQPDGAVDRVTQAVEAVPAEVIPGYDPAPAPSSVQDSWASVGSTGSDAQTTVACVSNTDCVDDGNVCTSEVCSEGGCFHSFNDAPCDDGNACTTHDQCQLGACLGSKNVCLGNAPARSPIPTQRPGMPSRTTCSEGSRMCTFGALGDVCVENDKCCSDNDCPVIGSYCSFFLTCDCAPGEHVCSSINTCSAGDCCPGDTCAPGQSCDDGNSCTNDVCVQQHNGTSTPYYLWEHQPIPSCGGCVANVGESCTSDPNACGQTKNGTIQCNGACSATTPPITGMHLACALGQCILFQNMPGQCTDVASCQGKKPGDGC